ncbi:GtrA family protein [Paenibacillus thiaminolyticus]|uniref:GtrA family protein n=1 Tax=Paenibacillus thiaminolyticus TaxID=49283 RepID=UPI0035A68B0C
MVKKMMKYGVVGVLGTLLHVGVLVLLVEWLGLNPIISSAIGFLLVLIVSYILNLLWTFGETRGGRSAFIKYAVVSSVGLLMNTGVMYVAVEWMRWPYVLGQLLVIFVVPPINFLLNYYWTFDYGVTRAKG